MFTSALSYLEHTLSACPGKVCYTDGTDQLTFAEVHDLALAVGSFLVERAAPQSGVIVMSGRHVYTPTAYLGTAMAGFAPAEPLKQYSSGCCRGSHDRGSG